LLDKQAEYFSGKHCTVVRSVKQLSQNAVVRHKGEKPLACHWSRSAARHAGWLQSDRSPWNCQAQKRGDAATLGCGGCK